MAAYLILIPLIFVLAINIFNFKKNIAMAGILYSLLQTVTVLIYPPSVWNAGRCQFLSLFNFSLSLDGLSWVFALSIGLVSLVTLLTGAASLKEERKLVLFVNLVLLSVAGLNGIVLVSDLFTLYVFIEVVSVCSFIMISLNRDRQGLEGAFKYVVLSAMATMFMISSISILILFCGDASFAAVQKGLATQKQFLAIFAVCVFLSGIFIKSGLMPFHGWLPDAYSSAPSGVSVFLAGIVTKTCGLYSLLRVAISVFGLSSEVQTLLLIIGSISIVLGALGALGQNDFKRMLAYSSISQMGYVAVGLGSGNPLGIAGAIFHLFNHSVFKAQLFVNSAAVEQETGSRNMDRFGGLTEKMPVTGWTSFIAFLSTSGIPPLSGFWSKLMIIVALFKALHPGYAAIAALASVVTLAYFLKLQRKVFFGKLSDEWKNLKEAGTGFIFSEILLSVITLGLGVLFPFLIPNLKFVIESIGTIVR